MSASSMLWLLVSEVPLFTLCYNKTITYILLLFRKFTSDFSDRYKVKPIVLDDAAKQALLNFRFPGNIRQLKNLAEQISVLEMDRSINVETLLKYLPQQSNLPALVNQEGDGEEQFSERDLLYKVLFDMKGDMNELKKLVLRLLKGNQSGGEILKEHENLFHNMGNEEVEDTPVIPNQYLLEPHESKPAEEELDYDKIEDISHETEEDESLSIEAKEKELIIKALIKNKNKRKYAAKDLGISERTLYRKIKQYGVEEL